MTQADELRERWRQWLEDQKAVTHVSAVRTTRGFDCRSCPHLRGTVVRWHCDISGFELEDEDLSAKDLFCARLLPPPSKIHARHYKWTPDQDALLAARWPTQTIAQLATLLSVTKRQLRYRAQRLGLRKR